MAAYATAERTARSAQFDLEANDRPLVPSRQTDVPALRGVELLFAHLADLVAERLAVRLAAPAPETDEWLDTRAAAAYLGVHRDTVRRLAAERVVPSEQEGPGCKLFFRRSGLDAWRCSDRRHIRLVADGQP